MSFGGFLDTNSGGGGSGGGGARIVADIPYSNHNMPSRLVSPLSKSMFASPGLSLALVSPLTHTLSLSFYIHIYMFICMYFSGY